MSERDERELDDYLRGGSRLSAAYREAQGEEPGAELDEVLLERARREVHRGPKVAWSPFTRSWSLPLALAAALVVSVTVTLMMHEQTGEPLPVPAKPAADALPAAPAPRAPREEAPPRAVPADRATAAERPQQAHPASAGESAAPALKAAPAPPATEEKAAAPRRARQEAAGESDLGTDPEDWVRRIEALRREGRDADAEALLAEFRKRFPDYPADRFPKPAEPVPNR